MCAYTPSPALMRRCKGGLKDALPEGFKPKKLFKWLDFDSSGVITLERVCPAVRSGTRAKRSQRASLLETLMPPTSSAVE